MTFLKWALVVLWAWTAGAIFATGQAREEYCGDDPTDGMALATLMWPVAVVVITIEGGWDDPARPCAPTGVDTAMPERRGGE